MTFRWLHFSDIHVGASGLSQLWPRFHTLLLEDLDRTLARSGPVDLLIFSGDLVQQGSAKEFVQFDTVIEEILQRISQRQPKPQIITVPGNHDLVRPSALSPETIALKQFWSNSALREAIWNKEGSRFRKHVASSLKNYTNWQQAAIAKGIHLKPISTGIMPGDATYVIKNESGKLGIVALNSTFLQLSAGDFEGQLHVDTRQMLAITANTPDAWVRENDANLLVTHHPAGWLHSSSPATWNNDINPAGRFDLHVFGHMHEPSTTTVAHGGQMAKRNLQAASMFGLEFYGDEQSKRIQGYSCCRIEIDGSDRSLTVWPRRLTETSSGKMKLVPDESQDLDEDTSSFSIRYEIERDNTAALQIEHAEVAVSVRELAPDVSFQLSKIRHTFGDLKAHLNVRRVEQQTFVTEIRSSRIAWICSDWGYGQDGFLFSTIEQLGVIADQVFSIDFSEYTDRESFFDSLQIRLGATFQQIGQVIAEGGASILILNDIDLSGADASTVADLESLARTVADFADKAFVVLSSRRRPRANVYQVIELVALDEADVGIYARDSEIGGERYAKPDAAAVLFRHTDGVPTRLDAALRDLEIISLKDLIASNPDFADSGGNPIAVPAALATTIGELQESEDKAEQRAYQLLLALASLPQGEQLSRLKRFLGPHPFGSKHARALLERSLIDTVGVATLDVESDSTEKMLIVRRPVRDYVRDTVDPELARSTDRKALDLYFGDSWQSGEIASSPTGRRVRDALCDGYEIQNASTLVLRSLRRALEGLVETEVENAIRLALAFVRVLTTGDHFRSAASICEDALHMLLDYSGREKEVAVLNYEYARSLRMIGRERDARTIFESIDENLLSKQQRQQARLGLALCFEREGDTVGAANAAKSVISVDRHTNAALQARVILAEQLEDDTQREKELRALLAVAQRKKANALARNILIELARSAKRQGGDAEADLRTVINASKAGGDFYNSARAIVELAGLEGAETRMSTEERSKLIEAYHYLYNERLFNLFDRCHDALWKIFAHDNDRANLLNLFRRSSFIWRLNGREEQETKYLRKLADMVRDLLTTGLSGANRDGAYFVVRITVVMGSAGLSDIN